MELYLYSLLYVFMPWTGRIYFFFVVYGSRDLIMRCTELSLTLVDFRGWEGDIKMELQEVWSGLIWLRIGTGGGHL